jgi:hypothetical protein
MFAVSAAAAACGGDDDRASGDAGVADAPNPDGAGDAVGDAGADALGDAEIEAAADAPTDTGDASADAGPTVYHDLTQAGNWSTYAPTTIDNSGATFDGRYIYFAPADYTTPANAGVVTRYDTQATFGSAASWSTFNTTSLNADAKGFEGAAFDGRYVYLVPSFNGAPDTHGLVTRYDTHATFAASASWSIFDTSTLNAHAKGFMGATFDGRYLYFVPNAYSNTVNSDDGLVVRYDTTATFATASSWSTFDAATVNLNAVGFVGGLFDGRYVYFVPLANVTGADGTVTRYDTQGSFGAAASWSTFDTTTANAKAKGFHGGAFDGRYIYLVPGSTGPVTRHDTQAAFGSVSSWSVFDTSTVNGSATGFTAAAFDGRYVYFVPCYACGATDSIVARFDTQATFGSAASWTTFDSTMVTANARRFGGSVFDGRYVYLVPGGYDAVARFDAKTPPSVPNLPAFFGSFM